MNHARILTPHLCLSRSAHCAGPASLLPAQHPDKSGFSTAPCRLANSWPCDDNRALEAYRCAIKLFRTFLCLPAGLTPSTPWSSRPPCSSTLTEARGPRSTHTMRCLWLFSSTLCRPHMGTEHRKTSPDIRPSQTALTYSSHRCYVSIKQPDPFPPGGVSVRRLQYQGAANARAIASKFSRGIFFAC